MIKCFLITGILSVSLICSLSAQNCNCLDSLDNANKQVQQYYQEKQIPTGKDKAIIIYDKFKPFAKLPHNEADCRELIVDYVEAFDDEALRQNILSSSLNKTF